VTIFVKVMLHVSACWTEKCSTALDDKY